MRCGRRERCTRRTTLYGARRHLSRGTPGPPWVEAAAVGYVAASVPLLGAPSLADSSAEVTDGSTLSFFLERALEVKRKEEEAVEVAELTELEEQVAAPEVRLLGELQKDRTEAIRVTAQPWPTLSQVEQLAILWFLAKDMVVKRRETTRWTRWRRAGFLFYYSS